VGLNWVAVAASHHRCRPHLTRDEVRSVADHEELAGPPGAPGM
jgi:hypothetical protein